MNHSKINDELNEYAEESNYHFDLSRRDFVQILGAGIIITVGGTLPIQKDTLLEIQQQNLMNQRLHIGTDGIITILTSKIEMGQGARTQLTMASAEELHVPVNQIRMIMGDTMLTPDDGGTAGSRTTPGTVPVIRTACAATREALIDMAAEEWKTDRSALTAVDGIIIDSTTNRKVSYGELARTENYKNSMRKEVDNNVTVTPVKEWKIMGSNVPKIGGDDIVKGAHRFPSDIVRPNMLFGKVLQPPSFGAELISIDISPAESIEGVMAVHDGNFAGVAAQTSHQAETALKEIAKTAKWKTKPHPSSSEIFSYLKEHSSAESRRSRGGSAQSSEDAQNALKNSFKTLSESYQVAYIQHAPLEPRAAVAEWENGNVTIWTGTQQISRVHQEVTSAFNISSSKVRIIHPDMGGGFGGKHTGEVSVQAARLAREAEKPVSVRWSREEEFTWAYFRPAGLIEIQAGLDEHGMLSSWHFVNYNSGSSAIDTPYNIPNVFTQYRRSESPLRQGSYRALASTANTFARESLMDEIAHEADADPYEFRMKHLKNDRIKAVLESAAKKFGWGNRIKRKSVNKGIGLACGTEKGSVVAACVEVEIDRSSGEIKLLEICEAFECGKIINPDNTRAQVAGCIIMGLGGALWEEIRFENGKVLNPSFRTYQVPRFKDVPKIDIILLDKPEAPSVGAGETPIIAVAPAIANAVFFASDIRIRTMPFKSNLLKQG
jgi:CO/xanthine dehydrogenase Mo-binding subunit